MLTNKPKSVRNTIKERIFESALKLFSEKGYLGATTREIAKHAGIAELTLFRHFNTKEKLFQEVINKYSFLPTLKNLLLEVASLSYEEALKIIAKRFLENLSFKKDLIRIMLSEMHRYPEQTQQVYSALIDEVIKTLASYFKSMQKKGELNKIEPDTAARAFLGMFFSYFNSQEIKIGKKYKSDDTEKIIAEYVNIFINGILKRK
jgi:AcrR family transcriptional regulator